MSRTRLDGHRVGCIEGTSRRHPFGRGTPVMGISSSLRLLGGALLDLPPARGDDRSRIPNRARMLRRISLLEERSTLVTTAGFHWVSIGTDRHTARPGRRIDRTARLPRGDSSGKEHASQSRQPIAGSVSA